MKSPYLLLLAGVLLAGGLSGCTQEETWQLKTYTCSGEEVRAIAIQAEDREIQVLPSEDGQVHLAYGESETAFYTITLSPEGTLTMEADQDKGWTDYLGRSPTGQAGQIVLRIPALTLTSLTLSTTQADLSLNTPVTADRLTLTNNSGDIRFDRVQGTGLTVETKNGDITGTVAGSQAEYAITCTLKKGESNLPEHQEGGEKTLTAANNNGDIHITFQG